MRESPAMVGDDGLYLLMTQVVRTWSMRSGPTFTPQQIAISLSVVTPLLCAGQEPICVALD